jgi:hypothetical protein
MTYADNVLAHYNAASADLRKRLSAVLAEAEKAQAGGPRTKPKPPKAPATSGAALRGGALASEGGSRALAAARERDARADRAFAGSTKMSADAILASEIKRVGEVEGLTPDEAAEAVLARYPLTRQKYIDSH